MADVLVNAARLGSLAAVERALQLHGDKLNRLDRSETTALLAAVWRNHLPIVERLLSASAAPDVPDGESGWTSLHRAFYWGHLRLAAKLLEAGARLNVPDFQGRTPLDLLSAELKVFLRDGLPGDVYSWGNGSNYQLGTGAEGLQPEPLRVDSLHASAVVQLAAAKFHSAALTEDGVLYTWGFGRGGRLGHPEFEIHSGETAVIVPRPVSGLGKRQVVVVSVAKHHTAAVTGAGELWTWGSNRDGKLGYAAVDSQPTPRRVATLRQRVVAVAAASKHTAAIADNGSVFSWGNNRDGQLGYGTSDSSSAAGPRLVEALKGKQLVAVSAAKRHTMVLTGDGDVYTWGHRAIIPRRVPLAGARDTARAAQQAPSSGSAAGAADLLFHKGQAEVAKPRAVAIAAGVAHSCCLTHTGVVLAWRSADPGLVVEEVAGALAGKQAVSISAGKHRTAVVTDTGDLYMWEGSAKVSDVTAPKPERGSSGKRPLRGSTLDGAGLAAAAEERGDKPRRSGKGRAFEPIAPARLESLKRITRVAVGEKHSLALQSWCSAPLPLDPVSPAGAAFAPDAETSPREEAEEAAWTAAADDVAGTRLSGAPRPSLGLATYWQDLDGIILEFADAAGAEMLRQHCMAVALSNLDAVLLEARGVLEQLPPHVLADLERLQKAHFVVSAVPSAAAAPEAATALRQQLASSSTIEGAAASGGRATGSAAAAVAGRAARLLTRRPTSAPDATGADEEAAPSGDAHQRTQSAAQAALRAVALSTSSAPRPLKSERSFQDVKEASEAAAVGRQVRHIKKKLQQIHALQQRAAEGGPPLDAQQRAKVAQRGVLETALNMLDGGAAVEEAVAMLAAANSAGGEDPLAESGSKPFELSRAALSAHAPFAGSSSRDADAVSVSGSAHGSTRSRRKTRARRSSSSGSLVTLAGSEGAAEVPGQAAADLSPSTDASSRRAESTTHAGRRSSAPGTTLHAEAGTASAGGGPSSLTPASRGAGGSFVGRTAAEPMSAPRPAAAQEEAGGFVTPGKAIRRGQLSAMFSTPTVLAGTPNMDAFHSQMSPAGATPTPPAKTTSGWALRQADQPRNPSPGLFGSSPPLPRYPSPMTGSSWANMAAGQASAGAAAAGADKAKKAAGKRKGGLSMFLAGEMDKPAAPAKASPAPSKPPPMEAPWGPASSLPSLRDIQDEEARQAVAAAAAIDTRRKAKEASVLSASSDEPAASRIPLAQFVKKSSPIAMAPQERKTASPAWGAVLGSSPTGGVPIACAAGGLPSLRDIQAQQQEKRDAASRSWGASPGSRGAAFPDNMAAWRLQAAAGALGSSPGASFPSGTSPGSAPRRSQSFNPSPAPASKWYIQEEREIVPLGEEEQRATGKRQV
ncbi:hypothetical protein WJX72_007451 [[Myrmecia] bisecta]|uniref:Uncharacterized protein n=1 Tax=[Myrmecia] bisecta TaxID=41462 RepID=A0AAW1PS58_9CHLO